MFPSHDSGFELQITYNKNTILILPSGTNKTSELATTLAELELSPHNVVKIKDAENDNTFLNLYNYTITITNTLKNIKKNTD